MIPLFRPHVAATAGAAVARVLGSGYLGEGPQSAAFEAALMDWLPARHLRVVSSGTAALELAYHCLGLGPGDEVIVSPLTCLATTQPLLRRGVEIVWGDVDPLTGVLDVGDVTRKLTDKTAAVVTVDWGGESGNLMGLAALVGDAGVPLIEDAAHAFGASHAGRPIGTWATFTVFSFQAIKTLTTGDGGALVCPDEVTAERVRLLRWFCLDRRRGESMRCYQQVPEAGFKMQLNDLAAAIGLENLGHVRTDIETARRNAQRYDEAFAGSAIQPLRRSAGSSCWLYSVRVPDAARFVTRMAERGVECSPVHARNDTQRIFAAYRRPLPGMDILERELVCLPVGWWVHAAERAQVIASARAAVGDA